MMKYSQDLVSPYTELRESESTEGTAYWHEVSRRDAWHATFNAAITGFASRNYVDFEDAVKIATATANLAHGAL